MTWLQTVDFALFQWINSDLSNPLFDALLPMIREKWFWAPLYLFIASFAWINFGAYKGWVFLLGLALSVGLADFTSSTLIKKNVQRLRPCNEPRLEGIVRMRASCGSGFSFTSSHAANHFAVAVFAGAVLGTLAPWIRPVLLIWAAFVAFAQVYVGVHYPGDVLGGSLLGIAIGWWNYITFKRNGWLPVFHP